VRIPLTKMYNVSSVILLLVSGALVLSVYLNIGTFVYKWSCVNASHITLQLTICIDWKFRCIYL